MKPYQIIFFALLSAVSIKNVFATDAYEAAVIQYFEMINNQQYEKAYDLLPACEISLKNCGGSSLGYSPKPEYAQWLGYAKNFKKIDLIKVKNVTNDFTDKHDWTCSITLNIQLILVQANIVFDKEITQTSGINQYYVPVVRGSDNKIRILGTGTAP